MTFSDFVARPEVPVPPALDHVAAPERAAVTRSASRRSRSRRDEPRPRRVTQSIVRPYRRTESDAAPAVRRPRSAPRAQPVRSAATRPCRCPVSGRDIVPGDAVPRAVDPSPNPHRAGRRGHRQDTVGTDRAHRRRAAARPRRRRPARLRRAVPPPPGPALGGGAAHARRPGGGRRRPAGRAARPPTARRPGSAATRRSPPGCTGSWSTPASTGSAAGRPTRPCRCRTARGRPEAAADRRREPAAPAPRPRHRAGRPAGPRRAAVEQRAALVLVDVQGYPVAEVGRDPRRGRGHGQESVCPGPGPARRPPRASAGTRSRYRLDRRRRRPAPGPGVSPGGDPEAGAPSVTGGTVAPAATSDLRHGRIAAGRPVRSRQRWAGPDQRPPPGQEQEES